MLRALSHWERALRAVVAETKKSRLEYDFRRAQATDKQKLVLAAVRLGCSSQRAIAKHTGLSMSDAANCVRLLRDKGYLPHPQRKGGHNEICVRGSMALQEVWR